MNTIIETRPIKIDPEILCQIQHQQLEEKQVIVHCFFECPPNRDLLIRIWATTYLVDNHSSHKSQLLFFDNISLYPEWTPVEAGTRFEFTLIFSGMPSDCVSFDLIEEIPAEGGFYVPTIARNKTDVYSVQLS
jgi:hypothetical protein